MQDLRNDASLCAYPVWWNTKFEKRMDTLDYDIARFVQYYDMVYRIFDAFGVYTTGWGESLYTLWPFGTPHITLTCKIHRTGRPDPVPIHYPWDKFDQGYYHTHVHAPKGYKCPGNCSLLHPK